MRGGTADHTVSHVQMTTSALDGLAYPRPRVLPTPGRDGADAPATVGEEHVLRAVVDACPDPMIGLDLTGRIVEFNAAAAHMAGWSRAAAMGRHVDDVVHLRGTRQASRGLSHLVGLDDDVPRPVEATATVTDPGGQAITVEVRTGIAASPEGTVVVVTLHEAPSEALSPDERLRRERTRVRRERRRAAQARRDTRRLSALEQAKSQFLNIASHELRSPLTVLRGYLSLIAEGSIGDVGPQLRQILPMLETKVSQMTDLVDEMLETARLDDHRLELDVVRVALGEVVAEQLEQLEPLREPGHRFVVECPDEPVEVRGDAGRLALIVRNLASNALKYSPGGGDITVRLTADGDLARLEVADQGLGIADEHQATLFTRFGRVLTPQTRHIPGTGLGLYLCRQLARLHRGDIEVRSRVGEGSVFTLVLPLARG